MKASPIVEVREGDGLGILGAVKDGGENFELAKRLLANAFAFYCVSKRIADGNSRDANGHTLKHWPVFYTNLGFAIELSLKAYLTLRGCTEDQIKSEIRHDLKTALDRARSCGLGEPCEAVVQLIEAINQYHRERSFVYLRDIDVKTLPNFERAIDASWTLFQAIEPAFPK